jgi:hypothetical protein
VSVRPIRLAVGFYRVPEVATTVLEEVVHVDVLTRVDVTRTRCFCLAFKIWRVLVCWISKEARAKSLFHLYFDKASVSLSLSMSLLYSLSM